MSTFRPMRLFATAILVVCATTVGRAADFPYTAYVNSADVYVRSGPGRNYYPTEKLQKGEKVEIYRHDPGGWYAIRPPRTSFSWVATRHLDLLDDTLATVNGERVVARVGSSFNDVRDVIQVRLEKGEKVELVEKPSDQSPWCKIAPPAGEFRWVFAKFVDAEEPEDGVSRPRRDLSWEDDDESDERDPAVRKASGTLDADAADERPRSGGFERKRARGSASVSGIDRELDRIEMDLSAMVAEDVSNWSFDDFHQRAEQVLNSAEGSAERGRAHLLQKKLARFEDIKQRHATLRRGQTERDQSAATLAVQRGDDQRFDGVGRLAPVVSQKSGGPQFALFDSSNSVVSYVTPAPGVNLRPYMDQVVGVNGQRGFMTGVQRQHINVQRITQLDTKRR